MAKFKKGQLVIRYSGYSSGGYPTMRIGNVGTVAKNQVYPGIVDIKEFPGGHEPSRLLRIDGLPPKLLKGLKKLINRLDHGDTHTRSQIIEAFLDGYILRGKNG